MIHKQELNGAGVGLRAQHYRDLLEADANPVPWVEILADNFLARGGTVLANLERVRERYPFSFHCVGMSLGSTDPLNMEYLYRLKELADGFQPAQISDHLAWVGVNGRYVHDLVPMPYTQESLEHMAVRIDQVQNLLGRTILIENPSAYLAFSNSEITEPEFLQALTEKTGCELLIDVNNIHVSAVNNGFSTSEYLSAIPAERVREIHLAGYEEMDGYLFDTHGQRVHEPVWALYKQAIQHFGSVPTLIEWDTDIPAFEVLADEAAKAQAVLDAKREAA
jgi:uncharacterized protein (UPF0276 family)